MPVGIISLHVISLPQAPSSVRVTSLPLSVFPQRMLSAFRVASTHVIHVRSSQPGRDRTRNQHAANHFARRSASPSRRAEEFGTTVADRRPPMRCAVCRNDARERPARVLRHRLSLDAGNLED
jgi:hypothetical protein